MKSLHLVSLALVFTATLRLGAADAPKLLHDLGHGQTSMAEPLKSFIQDIGVEFVERKEPLTAGVLEGVRLLYLRAPSEAFSAEEKESIVRFVRGGGSLLLVLDEDVRQSLEKTGANELIAPFGLKLTPDLPYLHNCGAIAKAGVINRADREIPYSGGRAVEGGTPFAFMLDKLGQPANAIAASATVAGGGRVVVIGEGMATLLFLGKPEGVRLSGVPRNARATTYWGKDSRIFMEEVIAWLVQR
jgi:hypothetical protein